jgi:small subunit ribosomal protein S20
MVPMPNLDNARKALRNSARKRVFNLRRIRTMKETLKSARELVAAGKKAEAQALVPAAYKAIDKAAKQGIIKPNAASRKKSRLVAFIKKA